MNKTRPRHCAALVLIVAALTSNTSTTAAADVVGEAGWLKVPINGREFKLAVHIFRGRLIFASKSDGRISR